MRPRSQTLLLILGLALLPACERQSSKRPAPARPQGVVGHVTAVQGQVTWSKDAAGPRTALVVGDAVQAGWTLHTDAEARVTLRLRNGHVWSLGESASKLAAEIQALSLDPVSAGALGQLADRGGPMDVDRTGAAGIQQERSAAGKAVSSHVPEDKESVKPDEEPARPAPREDPGARPRTGAAVAPRPAPPLPRASAPRPASMAASTASPRPKNALDGLLREGVKGVGRSGGGGAGGAGGAGPSSGESGELPEKPSPAEIRTAVNRLMPALRRCLAQPQEAGMYAVRITLNGQGRPTTVTAQGKLAGTATARCLERELRRLVVRPFRSPSMSFTYPVTLR